jgi:hypothetical protein
MQKRWAITTTMKMMITMLTTNSSSNNDDDKTTGIVVDDNNNNQSCLINHFLFVSVPCQQPNGQLQKERNILTQAINKEQTDTNKRIFK